MNRKLFISLAILAFFLGGSQFAFALTGFVLGDAANYAVIYQAGGNNQLNINNGPGAEDLAVSGNIGIANSPNPPNNGRLQLSGPLTLDSDIHFAGVVNDNGPYSGNIVVNGTISGGHANVRTDMDNLGALSTCAQYGCNDKRKRRYARCNGQPGVYSEWNQRTERYSDDQWQRRQ